MDGIIEFLVKKEKTSADSFKSVMIYAVAFVISALSFMYLKSFGVIGAAAAIYGAYYLSLNFDLEFEYCILGKDIRIEKILSRKKRKSFIEIEWDDILAITPISNEQAVSSYQVQKTIMASTNETDENNYLIIAKTKEGTAKIYIRPNDKMIEHFNTFMQSKIV